MNEESPPRLRRLVGWLVGNWKYSCLDVLIPCPRALNAPPRCFIIWTRSCSAAAPTESSSSSGNSQSDGRLTFSFIVPRRGTLSPRTGGSQTTVKS